MTALWGAAGNGAALKRAVGNNPVQLTVYAPARARPVFHRALPAYENSPGLAGGSGCQKTHGELERAEALSNFNRTRRRVRRVREDFCGGKSHFPEQKSFPCRFCARGFRRNPSKICEAENPKGFQVSPKAKLPTAKSKILTRHRGGGSGGGACSPVHQLVKKTFLTSCSPGLAGG